MTDYPLIPLPGSEGWTKAHQWGEDLESAFPGQDGHDLAYACESNGFGPADEHRVTNLTMVEQGERDGDNWLWRVTFDDGSSWIAHGGCDYTGWDCQSWLDWEQT